MTAKRKRKATINTTAIRLFDPDRPASTPDDEDNSALLVKLPTNVEVLKLMTLREAYNLYLEPFQHDRRADSTRSTYRTALNHWERCTSNPAISHITDQTIADFMTAMIEAGCTGTENLNKQWRAIHAILSRCARRGPKNPAGIPKGEHLVDDIPHWEPYPKKRKRIRVAARDHLSSWYRRCDATRWPRRGKLKPCVIWRAAIVLFYNYGPRTWDGLSLDWEENVFLQAECPEPMIPTLNEHGWLYFTPKKTARTKPEPLILPLNEVTRKHLDLLRGHGPRVFPVSTSKRDVQAVRALAQAAAGIVDPYTFQELRATCNTTWDRISRGLGRHVLGHGARDVNSDSYLQVIDELCEVAPTIPQPDAFLEALS